MRKKKDQKKLAFYKKHRKKNALITDAQLLKMWEQTKEVTDAGNQVKE